MKIQALNNRIRKLEEQEKEINKKTGKLKEKYTLEQKIKLDKLERKDLIDDHKQYSEKEAERRKIEIEHQRQKRKEIGEIVSSNNLVKNKVKI